MMYYHSSLKIVGLCYNTGFILFIFGAAIGSFLDVVSRRYDPDRFLFSPARIGGRSRCESCGRTLTWYELIPLVSFVIQGGRCHGCRIWLSFEYPLVETISGFIFLFVPQVVRTLFFFAPFPVYLALSTLWIIAFLLILLLSLIDIRLHIIPDEITIVLVLLGACIAYLSAPYFGLSSGSFIGGYALMLGIRGSIIVNRTLGLAFGVILFGGLIALTRGRGMGMGDLKLAAAFGILFGWPDVLAVTLLAFVIGALVGGTMIMLKRGELKSLLPFGPFLALGAALIFFFGVPIAQFYFGLAGI